MDEFLDKKLWKGGGRGVISNKNCCMFWKKGKAGESILVSMTLQMYHAVTGD